MIKLSVFADPASILDNFLYSACEDYQDFLAKLFAIAGALTGNCSSYMVRELL